MNDLRPKDGLVDIPIKVIKKINGKMFKHPTGDNTSNGSRVANLVDLLLYNGKIEVVSFVIKSSRYLS
jgi:hypothetical protein